MAARLLDVSHTALNNWTALEPIMIEARRQARVRAAITADDERGRNLRQNSPLAGLLSEPERRKLLEIA
jgi:hypothetical protein